MFDLTPAIAPTDPTNHPVAENSETNQIQIYQGSTANPGSDAGLGAGVSKAAPASATKSPLPRRARRKPILQQAHQAERLVALARYNVDAIDLYSRVVANIDDPAVRSAIVGFRLDHYQRARELAEIILAAGGEPPALKRRQGAFFNPTMTDSDDDVGMLGALLAVLQNEGLASARYKMALSSGLPARVRSIIERHRDREHAHMQFVRDTLRARFGLERINGARRVYDLAPTTNGLRRA